MRLIDTTTLQFEDGEYACEGYAILSHRWGDDEVSYQDYLHNKEHNGAGYAKIINFCRLAKQDGLKWAWVDTCCIDKKSSAELSEAIKSMYGYYNMANTCYVYLADMPAASEITTEGRQGGFRQSQWWRRGWTLQELLAPRVVEFYDCEWEKLGTKEDLLDIIIESSGIEMNCLYAFKPYEHIGSDLTAPSIAEIMGWMYGRSTLKSEDTAYCLMGLFNVNMPLLYGEGGRKAFVRLQLEIIKKSDDQSILAWRGLRFGGLLAPHLISFENTGKVQRIWLDNPIFKPKAFSMTNRGLKLRAPMAEADDGHRLMLLNCCDGKCNNCSSPGMQDTSDWTAYNHRWLAVKLRQIPNGQWERASPELFHVDPRRFKLDPEPIYVIQGYL